MINLNRGVSTPIALTIIIVLAVVLIGGLYYYFQKQTPEGLEITEKIVNNDSLKLKCGIVGILLPKNYKELKIPEQRKLDANGCILDEIGCMCVRVNPKDNTGVIFSITISDIGDDPLYNTESYQKNFLEKTGSQLTAELKVDEKVSREYFELFGVPALNITITSPTKTDELSIHRDILFIKNYKFFLITFASKKNIFDEQWSGIEQSIRNIEFFE